MTEKLIQMDKIKYEAHSPNIQKKYDKDVQREQEVNELYINAL